MSILFRSSLSPFQMGIISLGLSACIPNVEDPGGTEKSETLTDIDGDGWTVEDGDCWEDSVQPTQVDGALTHTLTSADIYPGAPDAWYDGIDANCDKADDFDQDGDGFVADEYEGIETLGVIGTGLLSGGDCEDTNAERNPAAEEIVADGIDSNCDDMELCLRDQDADGYGDGEVIETADFSCEGYGLTLLDGDCDVANPDIHPEQEEACDGVDTNCDGELWEDEIDADEDGYVACTLEGEWLGDVQPIGGDDCDDTEPDYHFEQVFYSDTDGDGYGISNGLEAMRCTPHFSYTALQAGDCVPNDATIHPNAPETNDGVDDNCDDLEADGYTLCNGEMSTDGYFLMCNYPMHQGSADSLCQQYGYDGLASVLSSSENVDLQSLGMFGTNGVWLSASDARLENTFIWGSGGGMQYTNWFGNHPFVNAFQSNCVTMDTNGQWREVPCSQSLVGFTCEKRF